MQAGVNNRSKVFLEIDGKVRNIRINSLNYPVMDIEMLEDLVQAIVSVLSLQEEGVTVIRSTDGDNFTMGFDASCQRIREQDYFREIISITSTLGNLISTSRELFVTMISGTCLGIGLEIALLSDYTYCTRGTLFGFPDILFGMPFLALDPMRKIYGTQLQKTILSGDLFGEEMARRLGIISGVVDDSDSISRLIPDINSYLNHRYKGIATAGLGNYHAMLPLLYDPGRIRLKQLEEHRASIGRGNH
ncbi:MAG: enoyl-CoA hydratase/isomerase family protein [Candidatus Thermoplasmatota archaeon]|nr:enoyl-CoA hydratase/isomerase family protein [Candidatus Thermoplasmatota archaeon]MCL5793678.1 enoyl-CoA hydratase/isomerase family protein [Candidatus Thermoplasmatota archaeon]